MAAKKLLEIVKCLYIRALRLCSPAFLDDELNFIYHALRRNAYPDYFIDKHKITELQNKAPEITAEKKLIFLQVPFYGDKAANSLRQSFSNLISNSLFV